jgi:hypothetical protein
LTGNAAQSGKPGDTGGDMSGIGNKSYTSNKRNASNTSNTSITTRP